MIALRVAALLAALLIAGPARAHAELVKSEPAANGIVAAPTMLELHFSEALAEKSTVEIVVGLDRKAVPVKTVALKGPTTMVVTPNAPLTPGRYIVSWTAISAHNGHKTQGAYAFTIE